MYAVVFFSLSCTRPIHNHWVKQVVCTPPPPHQHLWWERWGMGVSIYWYARQVSCTHLLANTVPWQMLVCADKLMVILLSVTKDQHNLLKSWVKNNYKHTIFRVCHHCFIMISQNLLLYQCCIVMCTTLNPWFNGPQFNRFWSKQIFNSMDNICSL